MVHWEGIPAPAGAQANSFSRLSPKWGAMRGLNKWVAALNVASMSCWCWSVSRDETPLRGMSVWRCVRVCVDRFLLIAHLA